MLGRTKTAIVKKRYQLNISEYEGVYAPPYYTQSEKEERIRALAQKLGVRLNEHV